MMKKHLSLVFIILIFFWNVFFFLPVISDLKQSPSKQSLYEGIFDENSKFIQVNITEENLLESVWQPIEGSFNFNFSNEKFVDVTNGTSIVEYDINHKIEYITPRLDIDYKEDNNSSVNKRMERESLNSLDKFDELHSASIFPPDDRQKITNTNEYPWSSICKLYITADDGTKWIGSGAIIDEFHILTAGHNVFLHDNGGWASSVEVVPGKSGSYEPFGSVMVTDMRSYTGWTQDEMEEHDWAVLTLDTNMGDYTGWLGIQTASSSHSIYTGTVYTAGYPGDLDYGENMYYTTGNGDSADEYNHWYWLDSGSGQSGSPVWIENEGDRYIVSVHAYSYDDVAQPNFGTRINQDKFDQIILWLGEDSSNPLPDLRDRGIEYSGFSPNQLSFEYSTIDIYNNIENIGFTSAGVFEVSFYLSTDPTVTTNDFLLATDVITSLDVNSYIESAWTGALPASIPDGNYYVGWIVDPSNNIEELNENNNIYVIESEIVSVDRTAPTSLISYTPKSGINKIGKNTIFSINTDDIFGSGVNITYYQIDNGGMREYTEEFTLAQFDLGTHTIYYSSVDNFQNIEEVNVEVIVKIDLSDTEIGLRIGLVIGIGFMEMVVYLFVVKWYLGLRTLTKFNKRKKSFKIRNNWFLAKITIVYNNFKKKFKKLIKKIKHKKKVNIYDLR